MRKLLWLRSFKREGNNHWIRVRGILCFSRNGRLGQFD
ncbi:MAG: hypothetical protein QOK14_1376, partial [Frankiaceae bacterium]|nr:hypothetical protein [Frankiaceae bacterium]